MNNFSRDGIQRGIFQGNSLSPQIFIKVMMQHNYIIGEVLYIDLRPCQTCHFKDGGSAYSIGVGELGWEYGTGLKSHGTATNWCTRRERPVNCMTVISTQWRSNMPFKRRRKWHIPMASYGEILSGRLNYHITRERQEVNEFLETRPVGDKMQ